MSSQQGISFLYNFTLGNRDLVNFGANIISVTSTAPGDFDKGNMTIDPLRQVWRSADVASWQEIVIKADLATAIDTIAILNHNLSETAVINLQGNISNSFVAPPLNIFVPWQKKHLIICQNFGQPYSYYRIRILDPSNACGYIEIGRIIGGTAFTFDKSNGEDINDDISYDWKDLADQARTEGFFRASTERIKLRALKVKFSKIRAAAAENDNWIALREMIDTVGISKPFLTIVDRLDPSFISLWGQLDDLPTENFTINRFVSMNLSQTEVW